jgi:glyoxylase-like metal-dependent hydrolase (beta-lactamase superfamily II)
MVARGAAIPAADRVLNSHCHEDHIAGNHLYPDASWHLHDADLPAIRSLDGMLELYGLPESVQSSFAKLIVEQFHFTPREDACGIRDGDVFELGGEVRVRVVHTPGHTRGHVAFVVEPDGVAFVGDVDLSSFGPYYGDASSDLEDFEGTLRRLRELEAAYFLTSHHIGLVEGRDAFLERLDRYEGVIADREARLLTYLEQPHTLEEVTAHRFVFRPHDQLSFADPAERRSMEQHIERLLRDGCLVEVQPGLYQASA